MTSSNFDKSITIITNCGLANRFRVLFSYYQYALDNSCNLTVGWSIDSHCNGLFLDYFQPIPNVNFLTRICDRSNCVYEGCNTHSNYQHPDYSLLLLRPYLQDIISNKINTIGPNYISLHIRRTDIVDKVKRLNRFVTDNEYFQFIDSYPDQNIYISTDNKNKFDIFKKKYPNRIIFDYHKTYTRSKRHTSLRDAIIDMYMCIHSSVFKGTPYSSFSDFIRNRRRNSS